MASDQAYDSFDDDDMALFGPAQPVGIQNLVPNESEDDFFNDSAPMNHTRDGDSAVKIPSPEALAILKKYYGYDSFRPTQWEIISQALEGRDLIVVMSTGYGKSVCYQIPPLIRNSLSIVISPLISLMEDQVANLQASGIAADYISTDRANQNEIFEKVKKGDLRLLYLTPEMATVASGFLNRLHSYVKFFAIDEAHCISQWGHEFRSAYRCLHILRERHPSVPIMALTATATKQVRDDIATNLKLNNAKIVCGNFDRENLYLEVRELTSIPHDMHPLLCEHDERHGRNFGGPAIVYCPTRARVEEINEYFHNIGVKSAMYHAGMSSKKRSEAHKLFSTDQLSVIVATVAFGMGIDKKDVRTVIHYGSPRNVESYYQEIGRAGRDGFPGKCIVFSNSRELGMQRRLIVANSACLPDKYVKHLESMHQYMETVLITSGCRRRLILNHFEGTGTSNGHPAFDCCDNCTIALKSMEQGIVARSAKDAFKGRAGFGRSIDLLRGTGKIPPYLSSHKVKSAGKNRTEAWWKALAQLLRSNGYFSSEKVSDNSFAQVVRLTKKAETWLESFTNVLELEPTPVLLAQMDWQNRPSSSSSRTAGVKRPTTVTAVASTLISDIKRLGSTRKEHYKECKHYPQFNINQAEDSNILSILRRALESMRNDISTELSVPCNSVLSNSAIQQLTAIRPTSNDSLKKVGDLPETRRERYGDRIIAVCRDFCNRHNIRADVFIANSLPSELNALVEKLTPVVVEAYKVHVLSVASLKGTADSRKLSEGTVCNYLVKAIVVGLPVHLEVLKINPKLIAQTLNIARQMDSDVTKLKPLFEKFPTGTIEYNQLKLILALLEYEYGVEEETSQSVVQVQCADVPPAKRSRPSVLC
ncbi:hypothetical protein QR680_013314 [Steinernema hermaphroditum]|uniref:ATP-dependent DNA helicase n=1 Tax=Steinernema hermaphroditum TaxID=289476 RepID=A0AA39I7E2_9BILA|nr:hypothetical protein QR680_013314 [Steinernema hermaphroditum]